MVKNLKDNLAIPIRDGSEPELVDDRAGWPKVAVLASCLLFAAAAGLGLLVAGVFSTQTAKLPVQQVVATKAGLKKAPQATQTPASIRPIVRKVTAPTTLLAPADPDSAGPYPGMDGSLQERLNKVAEAPPQLAAPDPAQATTPAADELSPEMKARIEHRLQLRQDLKRNLTQFHTR